MKVLLYTENQKLLSKSGLGNAIKHQMQSLDNTNVEYTTKINDNYEIAHINYYGLKSYFLAKKLKRKNVKIVYHAHSTEEDFRNSFIFSNQLSKIFKKWITKCYSLGDVIITPTEYSKELLMNYGIKKDIYAVSNGVDIHKFKVQESTDENFRKRYNLSSDDKIIIGIGLYIERKGIVDFVELAKRMPEYKFIWFGFSPLFLSSKKARKAVNTKLNNLIFAGYVEQKEIIEAFNECNLYIATTYEETEGIPILEAASCKTNMIIRDIPVFKDWITNEVNAYKAKDVNDFEIKIKKILNNELPKLNENSYQIALDRSYEKIGENLKNIYEKVLEVKK